ncbi:murein biosynthesis integral membrane protein MurJ [Aquabacterium sp. J223]|uniref:murein biosynthesis integral membrane protein MurJ n=1 Tax=Aquabacterium sp. J223 TaxID=2898431 RepID=UPI0021AD5D4F|nr:murein biosynthesis integral membrane protein MurJ [Aquabacterium sp. J223]UUX97655.1 murein biosynthesis integral membrane protein MurJ [Aquabacterium sp. J223]
MNLFKAASTVSLLTLASRITGLLRDMLQASIFGANALTDAFTVAFRIPNLLRRLVGEGAFSQAFVPLLAASRERDGEDATRHLIDAVATVLLWVLVGLCVTGIVGAPLLVWLIGSGLERSGGFDPAVVMTRWMFPYIACMSLVALSAGILNTWRRFVVPAATPVLLNLAWIGAMLFLTPWFARWGIEPVYSLAVGVMLGGVLQLAVQVPALKRVGALPRFGLRWRAFREAWAHAGVHEVLRKMAPALIGVSVAQISQLINTQIASHLGAGAVSLLTYADRLMEFPSALLGVALGVVLTPQLSAANARGDAQAYSGLIEWGLRQLLLLAVPCAVALLVFPLPLVATLFQRGAFGAEQAQAAAWAVAGYGVGLIGIVSIRILAPGYFAQRDTRTPVRVGIAALVLTQCFNAVFVLWLQWGIAGLALSTGLGGLVNAGLLLYLLWRRGVWRPAPGWPAFLARITAGSAVMGAGLWWAAQHIDWLGLGRQELLRAGWMAAVLAAAAVIYFGSLWLLGLRATALLRRQ